VEAGDDYLQLFDLKSDSLNTLSEFATLAGPLFLIVQALAVIITWHSLHVLILVLL